MDKDNKDRTEAEPQDADRGRSSNQPDSEQSSDHAEAQSGSSQNRRTHGLCSPNLVFRDEEERAQFEELCGEMCDDLRARGPMQEKIIRLLAKTYWRMLWVQEKIATLIENRHDASWGPTLRTLMWKADALELALPGVPGFDDDSGASPGPWMPLGLEQLELTVRGGDRSRKLTYESKTGDLCFNKKPDECGTATTEDFELRLKIGDSLRVLRRYEGTLRREFALYLELLHRLQRRRKKG